MTYFYSDGREANREETVEFIMRDFPDNVLKVGFNEIMGEDYIVLN
ncbi:hypothetical protein [Virgibacillus dakarensis]|nr:hypothetical protein [Virgibacillus dakarensis]